MRDPPTQAAGKHYYTQCWPWLVLFAEDFYYDPAGAEAFDVEEEHGLASFQIEAAVADGNYDLVLQ